ncbi:hypothetical protein GNI_141120 [Gregarina niphandrodes]|uniref:Uncharacterized protein n=1 Tax=Gregarina niphandrodes TaxID=110365 RepID=A0A023B0J0_GRENI|nr:hypothetical protein GNI_141120 [Gregarina niphandrodes]EZG45077.1 hypothetical protein GNI_141120 [Gregarina niphandrodes]|eukprot:XP_011132581.1 hypothetical protein GNI_141120 [Gregarina niphandrodes]
MARGLRETVAKNGPVVTEGLKQVVEDADFAVVQPTLKVYRSSGFLDSVLYVVRCCVGLVVGFLRGLHEPGCNGWFDRGLGSVIQFVSKAEAGLNSRSATVDREMEKCQPFSTSIKYGKAVRRSVLAMAQWASDTVIERLPKVNFDEESISRLGGWFYEAVGHTRVWSRVSQIYAGKVTTKESGRSE